MKDLSGDGIGCRAEQRKPTILQLLRHCSLRKTEKLHHLRHLHSDVRDREVHVQLQVVYAHQGVVNNRIVGWFHPIYVQIIMGKRRNRLICTEGQWHWCVHSSWRTSNLHLKSDLTVRRSSWALWKFTRIVFEPFSDRPTFQWSSEAKWTRPSLAEKCHIKRTLRFPEKPQILSNLGGFKIREFWRSNTNYLPVKRPQLSLTKYSFIRSNQHLRSSGWLSF